MFAAISVGADNRFGHPTEEVIARLREALDEGGLFLTSKDSTIEFITDGERLGVGTGR